jgi:hypothetical protein
MNRSLFITIHMYLSAFFAAFVLLVSISGGLYLLGVKGSIAKETVYSAPASAGLSASLNDPPALKAAVEALLAEAGVQDYRFEYVKVKGSTLYTRPTSRAHFVIELADGVSVTRATPSLQAAMMELHMGHGPGAFKNFQKVFAAGLIFIIMSGLWLGLSSSRLRARTLGAAGLGAAAFLAVLLF